METQPNRGANATFPARPGARRPKPGAWNAAGMSLVEASIILAVLAILTSVLVPTINGYVQDAKQEKCREDTQTIGVSITRLLRDTGETMLLVNGAVSAPGAGLGQAGPSHVLSNRVTMVVSDGDTPAKSVATPGTSTTDWDTAVGHSGTKLVDSMSAHLVQNSVAYRNLAGMNTAANFDPTSGQTFNSEYGWRGPYLSGPIDPDPWGHRYAANTEFFGRISGGSQTQFDNDVFVLCVGPDGEADTAFAGSTTTPGDDDTIYVVSGSIDK